MQYSIVFVSVFVSVVVSVVVVIFVAKLKTPLLSKPRIHASYTRPVHVHREMSFPHPQPSHLLRRTLHALSPRVHLIIVIIHAASHTTSTATFPCSVNSLQSEVLDHGVRGQGVGGCRARWEYGFESLDLLFRHGGAVLAAEAFGELDVELDVEVSVVVVAVRGHALAADDLDLAFDGLVAVCRGSGYVGSTYQE